MAEGARPPPDFVTFVTVLARTNSDFRTRYEPGGGRRENVGWRESGAGMIGRALQVR